MPHANRPAGPGKPINERRDRAAEEEELQQMTDEAQGTAESSPSDATPGARQAERDPQGSEQKQRLTGGIGRDRRRP